MKLKVKVATSYRGFCKICDDHIVTGQKYVQFLDEDCNSIRHHLSCRRKKRKKAAEQESE